MIALPPNVFVATAGWAIPRALTELASPLGTGLQKYASLLSATEINSTFYRRHRVKTFERWRASVPGNFRFAVKLPRSITHESALASPTTELRNFFDEVRGLGDKLGPVLVQLPASDEFDVRRAELFFRALRRLHQGPVACEPRHASWYGQTASTLLTEYDVARVIADPPRPELARMAGGARSLCYVRWHGSPHVYWSAYSTERIAALAASLRPLLGNTLVWCVFDNTASGAALSNALQFSELLETRATGGTTVAR